MNSWLVNKGVTLLINLEFVLNGNIIFNYCSNMAKTHEGLTCAVPCNSLGSKRIFTTTGGIKIRKVNGRYQYQPPTLKFSHTCTLDKHFPHPRDSRLYFNIQACVDNLLDGVKWRANWLDLEGSKINHTVKYSSEWLIGTVMIVIFILNLQILCMLQ